MLRLEHRIPPPLVTALFALAMWPLARALPTPAPAALTQGLAALALLLGLGVCLTGVWAFRRARTTVNPLRPTAASALVHAGIYRLSRNPMYLGFALLLVAWAAYLASAWALLGVLGFVLYMNRFQIAPEERALTGLFGADYAQYRARVRRWL